MDRRAGKTADGARRPHHAVDAKPDIAPDKRIEAERIEQRAQQRTGDREGLDDQQGQRIADQHIGAELVENRP